MYSLCKAFIQSRTHSLSSQSFIHEFIHSRISHVTHSGTHCIHSVIHHSPSLPLNRASTLSFIQSRSHSQQSALHSCIHSLTHFTHHSLAFHTSLTHSVHQSINSFTKPPIHACIHSVRHSFSHARTLEGVSPSFISSFTHAYLMLHTQSFTASIQSFTKPPTEPGIHSVMHALFSQWRWRSGPGRYNRIGAWQELTCTSPIGKKIFSYQSWENLSN